MGKRFPWILAQKRSFSNLTENKNQVIRQREIIHAFLQSKEERLYVS